MATSAKQLDFTGGADSTDNFTGADKGGNSK